MKVYYLLLSAMCIWTTPTNSQFFYSHYTPFQQISPVFQQPFLPALPAVPPVVQHPHYATRSSATYNIPAPSVPEFPATRSSVTYNFPAAPAPEFRGFGYRTDYQDGAHSTVFYVTGPEAENVRRLPDFPNFSRRVQEMPSGKARSLASDLTDSNAIPDSPEKIQNTLQPFEFQRIFDNILPGLVNFYNFPASTVPLGLARQLVNETTNETTTTQKDEAIAAESIVNPKVIVNHIEKIIKSTEDTGGVTTMSVVPETSSIETTTSTSTSTSTTTTTTTTESVADSIAVEARESKTESIPDTTTVETTTTV